MVSRSRAKPGSYSALTTSTRYGYVQEHIDISAFPKGAIGEIREGLTMSVRFGAVVETGVSGLFPAPGDVTGVGS